VPARRLSLGAHGVVLEDDAPELLDSDDEEEEEEGAATSAARRRRQQQLWRSGRERASWQAAVAKAGTSARVGYCTAALALVAARPLELARAAAAGSGGGGRKK
jgi:hypothetical protein